MTMLWWAGPVAAAVLAWALTGAVRRYALARRLVDVPNARSSHRDATPRGGGAAIVIVMTAGLAWLWDGQAPAVIAGGLIVAVAGFIDDHGHVSPLIRLAAHTLAAAVAVPALGIASDWLTAGLAVFFIVWLVNLTNFMDGIDGLAGVQTFTVCAAGAALSGLVAPAAGLWAAPVLLASATTGFLVWNWPPARIFMGDVGSGYVGYLVAVLTLRAGTASPELGWSWLILSGVFLVDATVTLVWRALRRERVFTAHRSHAYQHLAVAWGAHRPVTILVAAINVLWLTPLAGLVATGVLPGPVGLMVAWAPVWVAVSLAGAGRPGVRNPC